MIKGRVEAFGVSAMKPCSTSKESVMVALKTSRLATVIMDRGMP